MSAESPVPSVAFEPVERIAGNLGSGVLFLCDHASNALPPEFGSLGLREAEFSRHIAWDIGAAQVTRALAQHFGAPAILTRFSRLLIDANRGGDDPTLVMRISDGALIPGNARIDEAEINARRQHFWQPYRDAARETIDAMCARGPLPAIVSIHSFTPAWRGVPRPWQIGLLWDNDARLAHALWRELTAAGHDNVGDNEPYDGALVGDTMYEHGTARGLAHVLVELRQDLISDAAGSRHWAEQLSGPLAKALAGPEMHRIEHYGSRAGTGQRPWLHDWRTS